MSTHLRNLLLLAALCWVAPASAGYEPVEKACHGSSAASPLTITAEGASGVRVFDADRRAFLP